MPHGELVLLQRCLVILLLVADLFDPDMAYLAGKSGKRGRLDGFSDAAITATA